MDKYSQVGLIVVAFLVISGYLLALGVNSLKSKDYIESDTLIIPAKKLVIVNNKVDTIYQYKIK